MPDYAITAVDKADRQARIAQQTQASASTEVVYLHGQKNDVPVVRIPQDCLVYRMRNGRTQVEQLCAIAELQLDADFFEGGQENEEAQRIQHAILLRLSKDSKAPIFSELKRGIQTENLTVTVDGVVVNGNRRLAAMRDLYLTHPSSYPQYGFVDVAVLPATATEADLEVFEAQQQMVPNTKQDYGWIERRLKIRRQMEELDFTRAQIKDIYRFEREEDMNAELQQLQLAEEYLESYLQKPRAYREVAHSEQLFGDLQESLAGKSGRDADVRRLVGFLLTKEARNLGSRAYTYNPLFGKEFDKVMQRWAGEEGILLPSAQQGSILVEERTDDSDPLAGVMVSQVSTYEQLKPLLRDQTRTAETADKLARIYDALRVEEKEDRDRRGGLNKVIQALRALNSVDLSKTDSTYYPEMLGQLESIATLASGLRTEIVALISGNGGAADADSD